MNLAWIQEYKIVCTCWLFRLFPLILVGYAAFGWWFGSSLAVGVFQFGGGEWSGVTVGNDWACSVETLWQRGPTEGATRSHDRRGECACGERKGKEEQSVRQILALSLSVLPHSLSLSQTHTLPHSLLLCRLLLLNGGHEKKAGMMLPGGTRETTC